MSVEYDNVNSKDKKAGYWSGSTHTIPIEIYSEEKRWCFISFGNYDLLWK